MSKLHHMILLMGTALTLSGCESMDVAMNGMKDRIGSISNIDFSMPWSSEESGETTDENETKTDVKMAAGDNCPPISVVGDLNALHQFMDMENPQEKDAISSIAFSTVKSDCRYNEHNVVVDLDIMFDGTLGPRARVWKTDKPSFAYPYFVAITTPDGDIIAKEVFAATISYGDNQETATHEEHMRQIIPLNGDTYGTEHELLIGFQLTEDELFYNRKLAAMDIDELVAIPPAELETAAGEETYPNNNDNENETNIIIIKDGETIEIQEPLPLTKTVDSE